ncbi:MAG: hypothetical protein OYI31_01125 [Chloroflexota bacterium]|nr:hypothetical protein [Chloroflexota bacterium]MDE2941169.1 hypothetical protein [Chloroflexota bacterium]MDE3267048.1 hypothetical protein [Chloroflexota bacterium]
MSLLRLAHLIALRRIATGWRLEAVLFLGMLLAVSLMASGVIFSNLLEEAALRRTLDGLPPEKVHVSARTYGALEEPSAVARQNTFYDRGLVVMDREVGEAYSDYVQEEAHLFQTISFYFTGRPELELDDQVRPRGKVSYMSGMFPDRAEVVAGRWPYSDGRPVDASAPLEVALDVTGGEMLQLTPGDEIEAYPAVDGTPEDSMRVRVVGLFSRTEPADEFWYGVRRTFSHVEDGVPIVPLFTTENAILEHVARIYPNSYADVRWFYILDRHAVRAGDVERLRSTIAQVRERLPRRLENASSTANIDDALHEFQEQVLLSRIPLYLMVSLTTGILVYYLALISGLVVKSRARETAILKSRGVTTPQLGLFALVEGVLLAAPAIAFGPVLALAFSRALGRVFVEADLGSGPIPVSLPSQAFILGAAGAVLAAAVLTVSTLMASRQGMVEFRETGARPPRAPFIHRSYLDLLALALIGLLWWQIQARGSFLVRSLGTGELEVDVSLLLGPVLGLLALGLLVMRLFPLGVSLVARAAETVGPVWLVQGLRRVSRDPIMPGSLVVLLMLTTALGVMGSTLSSTIERNQRDRALYDSGANLRIEHSVGRAPVSMLGMSNLVQRLEGVETISEVLRTNGTLSAGAFDQTHMSIVAVDTDSFADVAWYRNDFTDGETLPSLTEAISIDPSVSILSDGIQLPPQSTSIVLWVNPGTTDPSTFLVGRVRDDTGYYFDVPFGSMDFEDWELDSQGWVRVDADLFPPAPRRSRRPLRVDSRGWLDSVGAVPPFTLLSIRLGTRSTIRQPGAIFLGDLSVGSELFGEEPLGDYRGFLEGWHMVEDYDVPGLYALEASSAVAQPGTDGSAAMSWIPGGLGLPTLRVGKPETPIPAVVSRDVLDVAGVALGDVFAVGTIDATVPVRAVAVADYFPTLDPREGPFVVVDLRTFNHYTNLHGQGLVGGSNEMWTSLDPVEGDADTVVGDLRGFGINTGDVFVASDLEEQRVQQPLVSAGWGGLLILMFLALTLASASGVMLYSFTDARERSSEFALLRTLGFSRLQLHGVVWFNLLLVAACGVGLGTWAGQQITASVLPILEIAEEGVRVTPPMVVRINWGVLAGTYAVLAVVAAVTVVWLALVTARLEVQRVLRIGEA